MNKLFSPTFAKASVFFYAAGLSVIAYLAIFFGRVPSVLLQDPSWLPFPEFFARLLGVLIIAAAAAIISGLKPLTISLLLGGILLALFIFWQFPYMLLINPYNKHLGVWSDTLKLLALAGGAFAVAGNFYEHGEAISPVLKFLSKGIPLAGVFFSITMILFGVDHFLYRQFVADLIPSWIPFHLFWTYLAGVALIGSGIGMILKRSWVALLTGLMIFLWFLFLHIPRAFADPVSNYGNEVISVGEALAFSGGAWVMGMRWREKGL